ncbi:MAG TPA: 5-formyltetrahydrofolate cyclo-ligase [Fontimonas sp.]
MRRELRLRRAAVSAAQRERAARRAVRILTRQRCWQQSRRIALYLPHGSELSTRPLIDCAWAAGKEVCVPRITGAGTMQFVSLSRSAALRANRLGIQEPAGRAIRRPLATLDLLLVPLVGFDARGYRLGAGGGYYDRKLQRRIARRPLCLGWALALQQISAVPRDPWDQRLDGIVTERGIQWPIG